MGKRAAAILPDVAERQREERLLTERIDAAGELKRQKTAIERAYGQIRSEVAALVKKLYGTDQMALGEIHTAMLKYDLERFIDCEGLFRDIEPALFFRMTQIPLGMAERVLAKEVFTKHLVERQASQPTLYIGDRVTEPEEKEPRKKAKRS